ncbi:helix-turn-helix domain-containing protein [Streptomyces rimosus]|uniref:helix-turn-helix domain-containing protein n=1 Tax=Streptomyces rimosus TaxID=1927 RepID=UPI0031E0CE8C
MRQLAVGMSLLDERGMTLAQPAERVGVTVADLSVQKNDRARAIRYHTLSAICRELGCRPGDLLTFATEGGGRRRPGDGR